jgi:membrane-associated PAP2 superfamily phosphatase
MPSPSFLDYYRSPDGQRFLLRQTAFLILGAIALLALFGSSDLDRSVSRWFFHDAQRTFPLVNHWLLKTVLHDAAQAASALAALALVGVTASAWLARKPGRLHGMRRELLFASVAAFISAALVGALKHFSTHVCPWDLTDFGGLATYRQLFTAPTALHAVRGCLPAAHPLTGYAWLGVGFVLYPTARRLARQTWYLAFTAGTVCGFVQVMRGAHFLSHVLWSAWLVWAVSVAILAASRIAREHALTATDSPSQRRPTSV